jgi:formylglycine-generating enzyme required for sulfatase activity
MHGNAWEWCEDIYNNSYNGAPTDSSTWLSGEDSKIRVERGGSFNDEADSLRSAYRDSYPRGVASIGFRLAAALR